MGKVAKVKSSLGRSNKQKKQDEQTFRTLQSLEAVKMIALYVLRNQGWGATRLSRFNEKWNQYVIDISHGYFSLSDIAEVLEEECGLTLEDLKIKAVMEVSR